MERGHDGSNETTYHPSCLIWPWHHLMGLRHRRCPETGDLWHTHAAAHAGLEVTPSIPSGCSLSRQTTLLRAKDTVPSSSAQLSPSLAPSLAECLKPTLLV